MEIKIAISGTTPLLMNKFHDAAQMSATDGTRGSLVGDKGTPREQAELKLYTDASGNIIIPQPNLYRCILDAGKYFKAGKSKVTTLKSSLIPACLSIEQITIPLIHPSPWEVDTRPVRIPSTGGRILAHRPMFNEWGLEFDVDLDTEIIGAKMFREIVDAAGKRIGLGDFRPDCKGPYGRFVVTGWRTE